MTDVLGVCESWEDDVTTLRREDGSRIRIAVADIVSGKPVPPRPSVYRRLGAVQADLLVQPGWAPVESARLGDWVLRASGGFSSRGSSVLALGDPGIPLAEAVDCATRWYRDRGLPPRAHVHPGDPVTDAFLEVGWTPYDRTLLMLCSVARVLRRLGPDRAAATRHEAALDGGWLATDERVSRFGEDAIAVLEAGEVTFVTVRDEKDEVLARGRGAVHGDWVGASSLWTREDLRGTGLGRAVLATLLEWGAERGATTSYLQVLEANQAARQLYEACGYEVHHHYDYLIAP